MKVRLFEKGKVFFEKFKEVIENNKFKKLILDTYEEINEFSNETFIITYDNLIVYAYKKCAVVIGTSEDYSFIVNDIFVRNINIVKVYTESKDFLEEFRTQFKLSIKELALDEYSIRTTTINRCIFSGGCFWCMAHPYYTFDGVLKVISGYAGGKSLNPTYEETKHGNGYRETVMIIYDRSKITYKDLLKLYFESIDPFDNEGQFIDKGHSYTTCVYYKSALSLKDFRDIRDDIESRYHCPVKVALEPDTLFYPAEEEHQDFEFKFKNRFEKEEKISGRNDFKYVKLN